MRPVPWIAAFALILCAFVPATGCADEQMPAGDECAQARAVFTKCGVTVPLLEEGACTGVQRMVARCVAHHGSTCEDLSTLLGRIDVCAADELDGGDLAPVADLPVPPPRDAATDSALDAPLPVPDAGPVPATLADASTDAPLD